MAVGNVGHRSSSAHHLQLSAMPSAIFLLWPLFSKISRDPQKVRWNPTNQHNHFRPFHLKMGCTQSVPSDDASMAVGNVKTARRMKNVSLS